MVEDSKLTKGISFKSRVNLVITSVISNKDNFASWSVAIEVWFEGQDVQDHLMKQLKDICESNQLAWKKLDARLCFILW